MLSNSRNASVLERIYFLCWRWIGIQLHEIFRVQYIHFSPQPLIGQAEPTLHECYHQYVGASMIKYWSEITLVCLTYSMHCSIFQPDYSGYMRIAKSTFVKNACKWRFYSFEHFHINSNIIRFTHIHTHTHKYSYKYTHPIIIFNHRMRFNHRYFVFCESFSLNSFIMHSYNQCAVHRLLTIFACVLFYVYNNCFHLKSAC